MLFVWIIYHTLGEKLPHSKGNVGKYSLHGAFKGIDVYVLCIHVKCRGKIIARPQEFETPKKWQKPSQGKKTLISEKSNRDNSSALLPQPWFSGNGSIKDEFPLE